MVPKSAFPEETKRERARGGGGCESFQICERVCHSHTRAPWVQQQPLSAFSFSEFYALFIALPFEHACRLAPRRRRLLVHWQIQPFARPSIHLARCKKSPSSTRHTLTLGAPRNKAPALCVFTFPRSGAQDKPNNTCARHSKFRLEKVRAPVKWRRLPKPCKVY